MGKFKVETGKTRVGAFLKDIAPHVLDVAASLTGIDALDKIGHALIKDDKLTAVDKQQALSLLEMDRLDRENARGMQISALNQDDKFSKRFIYYLAAFWSLASVSFFFIAGFTEIKNERIVDTILGFVLGSIVATMINFFFGSSQGSKDKTEKIFNQ